LADLPAQLLGRLRSDRVMRLPAPPRQPATVGRPRKHGRELALSDPATWPAPQATTSTMTSRYGTAAAAAWDRVHPRLTHRAAWPAPKIRDPAAADRWTGLIITAHTQLRLARPLADDLRLPWERPALPGRLTPARVRRGFRNIRATIPRLAGAPKPGKPGPGRPRGCPGPSGLRILIGSSPERTGSSAREIPEVH